MSEYGWVDPTQDHPECDMLERYPLDSSDVRAWITLARKLERKARFFQNENHMRAGTLRRYHDMIGYNNDDGFHAEPGPEEMLAAIIARAECNKSGGGNWVARARDLLEEAVGEIEGVEAEYGERGDKRLSVEIRTLLSEWGTP